MISPPDPPKGMPQVFDRRGARAKAQSRPPARFSSPSNTRKYIITTELKHESETACLLRPLRCLLSMSQRVQTAIQTAGAEDRHLRNDPFLLLETSRWE